MFGTRFGEHLARVQRNPPQLKQFKFAAAVDQIVFGKLPNGVKARSVTQICLMNVQKWNSIKSEQMTVSQFYSMQVKLCKFCREK